MLRPFKWVGIILGSLIFIFGVAVLVGWARLHRRYDFPTGGVAAAYDSSSLARGEHLVRVLGCPECHGEGLGGQVYLDIPLGRFVAPNLTRGRGGVAARYAAADWDRALRYGLRADHRSLLPVMPYRLFNHLSDADAAAVIAYVTRTPPIDHETPPSSVRLPGYMFLSLANMDQLRGHLSRAAAVSPPVGTAAEGHYLAATICEDCHGPRLEGGKHHPAPDAPPTPNLVPAATWPAAVFAATVRTGIAPDGRHLNPWMPATRLRYLTDDELQALQAYLRTLQPHAAAP